MQHPFFSLRPEYEQLLAAVQVTRPDAAARAVDGIDRHLQSYIDTGKTTGIPPAWIAPTDYRESDCNPRCGIGQGDPWNRVSRNVPKGCGPFRSKAEADTFYLHYDHIDDLQGSPSWSLPYMCWAWEKWNGFGPRSHGIHTGYLWAGTNHYERGKYVADSEWRANTIDTQCGTIPVYLELIRRHPELAVGPAILPAVIRPPPVPAPVPVGVGGGDAIHDTKWIQARLNEKGADPPLILDGSYGRRTREAVRTFQGGHGLQPDGLAGPLTIAALAA